MTGTTSVFAGFLLLVAKFRVIANVRSSAYTVEIIKRSSEIRNLD
jgi:hypothetical protein